MGKTLSQLFAGFSPDEIAQFYIHNGKPERNDICRHYYQFTDTFALKSVFTRRQYGCVYKIESYEDNLTQFNKNNGSKSKVYETGRKRTPFIYIMRECIWNLGRWKTPKFIDWITDFDPDVIFLASGDYAFMYNIAFFAANLLNKPLVMMCFDDFYLYNMNQHSLLGRIRQKYFMKTVKKVANRCSSIITVCQSMADAYSKLFHKKCHTLYTSAQPVNTKFNKEAKRIAYFGSLGLGRDNQLVEIGKVLLQCKIEDKPKLIDVFTFDQREEALAKMVVKNGIRLNKGVTQDEMYRIYSECRAVIHVESFDPNISQRTKYSLSTKIAESMASAPCLFAYGPKGIGSIEYLIDNNSAIVVTNSTELEKALTRLFIDEKYVDTVKCNARKVASKNHDIKKNYDKLYGILQGAIDNEF